MLKRSSIRLYRPSRLHVAIASFAVSIGTCLQLNAQQIPATATVAQGYGQIPMAFEENQGQSDTRVKFLARGKGYGLFLTAQDAVLTLHTPEARPRKGKEQSGPTRIASQAIASLAGTTAAKRIRFADAHVPAPIPGSHEEQTTSDVLRLRLANASPGVQPEGLGALPGIANYIRGNDPSRWHTNIPTYSKVRYSSVYPGVDLVYYGNQGQLEYDFIVAPGASARTLEMQFDGARKLEITSRGDLSISTGHGSIVFQRPVLYQQMNGTRKPIKGGFNLLAKNTVGFRIGRYDHSQPLVIDPTLLYSTYLGGTFQDFVTSVAAGPGGSAYVTGLTVSEDFPLTAGAFQSVNYASETSSVSTAFISKFNASGTALLYSTYLGGDAISGTQYNQGDYGKSIAVDSSGDAFVTGYTYSTDFPVTSGSFQTVARQATSEATGFVTKLNPAGTGLLYSTYLGGNQLDEPTSMTIDASGNAFVSGVTYSTNFPTTSGAFQTTNKSAPTGGYNRFVTKLNPSGTALVYSTYLGGANEMPSYLSDFFYTNPIVVDASGNAYVAAFTNTDNFPTTSGAYQKAIKGSFNATLSKFNATGTSLIYSTYLGGSANTFSEGLAVDSAGNAYIAGFTTDTDFPVTAGSFQQTNHATGVPYNDDVINPTNTNGFVTKINPSGSALVYSTYLGGTTSEWGGDQIYSLALDSAGDAIVAGLATSSDFPLTSNAYQSKNNGATQCCAGSPTYSYNAFITQFNPTGTALLYSTYFGGSGEQNPYGPGPFSGGGDVSGDAADDIALSSTGELFMVGYADSTNFPTTPGAFETVYHSQENMGFVTAFNFGTPPSTAATITTLTASGNPVIPGTSVTFTASVAPATGTGTPTGTIVFSVDEATAATVTLASGKATYTVSNLAPGEHYVLATYSGSSTYTASGDGFNEVIQPVSPVISPAAGTYTSVQTITIADATPSSVLYFTIDGTAPTVFSTLYTTPIALEYTHTVSAVAVSGSDADSKTATSVFTLIGSPSVLGAPATAIATPNATLNAFVNSLGLSGSYLFRYGTSAASLSTASIATTLPAATAVVQATAKLTGLASKTTYFYQVVVTTAGGVTTGPTLSFTTN